MKPQRHIVWSTDTVDLSHPFQRRWYLRQVLLHGRAEDIRTLNLEEIAQLIDNLDLPPHIRRLWQAFLKDKNNAAK